MNNIDHEAYLAWTWATKHPFMYTVIEVMTSTPMIALAISYGAVRGLIFLNKK